jgi:multidrug resistance efflux pump
MRFRSVLRPKAGNGASLTSARSSSKRLWWCSRARATLFTIGAVIIAAVVADRAWIRGNGIVSGELTAVAPIVQARLQRLLVNCLDRVVRGQHLAEFDNEATVEGAAQQLQQLQLQLTQARAEIDIAEAQAQAALKLVDAQVALFQQLKAVLKAQDELVQKQYVAALVWEKTKADVARAEAETRAAEFVYETKKADQKKAELAAAVLQQRIDSFKNSPELTGHFFLTAPKDGIVTECAARPGEVIAAKTPIFQIFNPDDSYAVVFFDPNDVAKLAFGQRFTLSVGGIEGPVTARLTGFYPELSALPSSLTRYFWQQEKWSQYAPVRLDFDRLSPAQTSKVFAWAQLSASRWQGWGLPEPAGWVQLAWQWVRDRTDNGRQHRAAAALAP